jgi:hypothetical protein
MIISQLISRLFVQFHVQESLLTAVSATKHAGVKKCIVFQINKRIRQSSVEVKQAALSVSSTQFVRCMESISSSWHRAGKSSTDTPNRSAKSFISNLHLSEA